VLDALQMLILALHFASQAATSTLLDLCARVRQPTVGGRVAVAAAEVAVTDVVAGITVVGIVLAGAGGTAVAGVVGTAVGIVVTAVVRTD
jgi:hypothetical protein